MNELLQACTLASALTCVVPPPCPLEDARAAHGATSAGAPCSGDAAIIVRADDPWLGADKFTHVGASWAAVTFVFGAARSAGVERDDALLVAGAAALMAGIAKELVDRRRYGLFSLPDLVADVLGIGAAYFFLREVR